MCAPRVDVVRQAAGGRRARRPMVDPRPRPLCSAVVTSPRVTIVSCDGREGPCADSLASPHGLSRQPGGGAIPRGGRSWLHDNLPDELRGHRGGEARFDGPVVRAGAARSTTAAGSASRGLRSTAAAGLRRASRRSTWRRRRARSRRRRRRDRPRHGGTDDHQPRHGGAEGALPAAAPGRRRDLVPGLLRAGRRVRSRRRAHIGAARGRPVRAGRPEGLVVLRPHRRLLHPPRPLRPRLGASWPG